MFWCSPQGTEYIYMIWVQENRHIISIWIKFTRFVKWMGDGPLPSQNCATGLMLTCRPALEDLAWSSPFTCSPRATAERLRWHSPPPPDLQIVGCCCCTHPHWSWPHPPPLTATWPWFWGWSLTSGWLCLRRKRPGSRGCLLTPWLNSLEIQGTQAISQAAVSQ